MKILFMGTPDFAVFSFQALLQAGHRIEAVVTQPDKPKGRGYVLTPPPVKQAAQKAGIPVLQPQTLKDESFMQWLCQINPEVIVVVAYGKILPEAVLSYPAYGCINVHGSLLPEYRGAAPMQRAILDGKAVTGITTMYMDIGLDTGDMLLQESVPIEENDNFETVHDKLGLCGASLLVKTLSDLSDGTLRRTPQNDQIATYAAKITKEECLLNFDADAQEIHNRIRGLSPIPLSFTHTPNGKRLKIIKSRLADRSVPHANPGEILSLAEGITVACRIGSVQILEVLPEGKSRMSAVDFIRGNPLQIGDILA